MDSFDGNDRIPNYIQYQNPPSDYNGPHKWAALVPNLSGSDNAIAQDVEVYRAFLKALQQNNAIPASHHLKRWDNAIYEEELGGWCNRYVGWAWRPQEVEVTTL